MSVDNNVHLLIFFFFHKIIVKIVHSHLLNSNTLNPTYMGLFKVNDIFFLWISAKLFSNTFQLMHVGLDIYLIKS